MKVKSLALFDCDGAGGMFPEVDGADAMLDVADKWSTVAAASVVDGPGVLVVTSLETAMSRASLA